MTDRKQLFPRISARHYEMLKIIQQIESEKQGKNIPLSIIIEPYLEECIEGYHPFIRKAIEDNKKIVCKNSRIYMTEDELVREWQE